MKIQIKVILLWMNVIIFLIIFAMKTVQTVKYLYQLKAKK